MTAIFRPLDEAQQQIRVVHILPSRRAVTQIRCELEVISLKEDNHPFHALSWYWGDPDDARDIVLCGHKWRVPRFLEEAMREIRPAHERLTIWIDCICINQRDPMERASQILLMGSIYSKACHVIIWLGILPSREYNLGLEVLRLIGEGMDIRQVYIRYMSWKGISLEYAKVWTITNESTIPQESSHPFLEIILNVLHLPWWNRLWVVQECVLSHSAEFRWNGGKLNSSNLLRVYEHINRDMIENFHLTISVFGMNPLREFVSTLESSLAPLQRYQNLTSELRLRSSSPPSSKVFAMLIEVLVGCKPRSASDPRDKIYGLLGLFPSDVAQTLNPSYTQSMVETYVEISYQILDLSRSFMMFNCITEDDPPSLPFWVPDWSFPWQHYENTEIRVGQYGLFEASGSLVWSVRKNTENALVVKGIRVDRLHEEPYASLYSFDVGGLWETFETWYEWIDRAFNPSNKPATSVKITSERLRSHIYPTGCNAIEALWNTAVQSAVPVAPDRNYRTLRRVTEKDIKVIESWFQSLIPYRDDIYGETVSKMSDSVYLEDGTGVKAFDYLRDCVAGRGFFLTQLGYMGISREDCVESGDEIWIMSGASHPVILRPHSTKKGHYIPIAEAYVHGIMDGEVTDGRVPVLPRNEDDDQQFQDYRRGVKELPFAERKTLALPQTQAVDMIKNAYQRGVHKWLIPDWEEILID